MMAKNAHPNDFQRLGIVWMMSLYFPATFAVRTFFGPHQSPGFYGVCDSAPSSNLVPI